MIALNEETSEKYCLFVSLNSSQNGVWSLFHTAAFHAKCCKNTNKLRAESPFFKGVLKTINMSANAPINVTKTRVSTFDILLIFNRNVIRDKIKQNKNGKNNSGLA